MALNSLRAEARAMVPGHLRKILKIRKGRREGRREGRKEGRKEEGGRKEGGKADTDSLSSERSIALAAPRIGLVFPKKVGAQKSKERQ